jgi:hypothetical protein
MRVGRCRELHSGNPGGFEVDEALRRRFAGIGNDPRKGGLA